MKDALFKKILGLCNDYLNEKKQDSVEELEKYLDEVTTQSAVSNNHDYILLAAAQRYTLAKYYVEDCFKVELAEKYASESEVYFSIYINDGGKNDDEKYLDLLREYWAQVKIIHAYALYQQEKYENVISVLSDVKLSELPLALAGSAFTDLAYTKDRGCAYPAFDMLRKMDQGVSTWKSTIEWVYIADILQKAYTFLATLYYEGATVLGESRIPRNLNEAVACLKRIDAFLPEGQQKEWIKQDIERYTMYLEQ